MLPSPNRMHRSQDFSSVVRGGRRAQAARLVVHHRVALSDLSSPPLVGLIVSKSVGGSVVRHQVSRRLRGQLSTRLSALPLGSATVVRALPASASASSAQLGADLDRALVRLARR